MWYLRSDGKSPDYIGWVMLAVVAVVTVAGYPLVSGRLDADAPVSAWHVWYFGWLTAVSTGGRLYLLGVECSHLSSHCSVDAGLGVVPFFFSDQVPKDVYLGFSNGKLPA